MKEVAKTAHILSMVGEEDGLISKRGHRLTIGNVLRRNSIQKLRAYRYSKICKIAEQLTSHAKALVDLEGTIDVWVVNKTFPADRGAWFLAKYIVKIRVFGRAISKYLALHDNFRMRRFDQSKDSTTHK